MRAAGTALANCCPSNLQQVPGGVGSPGFTNEIASLSLSHKHRQTGHRGHQSTLGRGRGGPLSVLLQHRNNRG